MHNLKLRKYIHVITLSLLALFIFFWKEKLKSASFTITEFMNTVGAPYPHFCFPWFQLPMVNCSLKILSGKFQKSTIGKFSVMSHFEYHDEISHHPNPSCLGHKLFLCPVYLNHIYATCLLVTQ